MIRSWHALLGSLALLAATPALAAAPAYTWFDASYLDSETDNSNLSGDGYRLGGSVALSRWAFSALEYDVRSFDRTDSDLRFTSFGFGAHSLKRAYQLFAVLSYERVDLNSGVGDVSDDGYGLQFGVRVPIERFALQLDYRYLDYGKRAGEPFDDARYRFTGEWNFLPKWAAVASYQMFDDFNLTEWTLGVRRYLPSPYERARKRPAGG